MNKKKPLLAVKDLVVEFNMGDGRRIQAVSGVSFQISEGETLGLVGESGCGKSSIARALLQLLKIRSGKVIFMGRDLALLSPKALRNIRPDLQMIFQDSVSALNPRRCIGKTIAMGLNIKKNSRDHVQETVEAMMVNVGLDPGAAHQKPHQFSGGQCQRIQIARALMTQPRLLVCDEPVSSLDVSIQAQILNLLESMRQRYGLTVLFISHDLAVVKNVSDRVAVMYLGRLCEIAPSESLYRMPAHPYTAALLQAIPVPEPSWTPSSSGIASIEKASLSALPSGCRFHPRCSFRQDICTSVTPELKKISYGREAACHFPLIHQNR